MEQDSASAAPRAREFAARAWTVAGIVLFIGSAVAVLVGIPHVFLLSFAGLLLAVCLTGAASWLAARTRLGHGVALGATVLALLLFLAATAYLFAAPLFEQGRDLVSDLPAAYQRFKDILGSNQLGQALLPLLPNAQELSGLQNRAFQGAARLLSGAAGFFGSLLVMLVLGIFLAVEPDLYRKGFLRLIPRSHVGRIDRLLGALGNSLRAWFVGRLLAMAGVWALTSLGLMLLGVPNALAVGLIAGLFDFVPNIGPLVAAVPALLLAAGEGLGTLAGTAILYLIVQGLEGYLITPLIQQKVVSLPPALLLVSQLVFAALLGLFGLIFATPLTVVILVVVKHLYLGRDSR